MLAKINNQQKVINNYVECMRDIIKKLGMQPVIREIIKDGIQIQLDHIIRSSKFAEKFTELREHSNIKKYYKNKQLLKRYRTKKNSSKKYRIFKFGVSKVINAYKKIEKIEKIEKKFYKYLDSENKKLEYYFFEVYKNIEELNLWEFVNKYKYSIRGALLGNSWFPFGLKEKELEQLGLIDTKIFKYQDDPVVNNFYSGKSREFICLHTLRIIIETLDKINEMEDKKEYQKTLTYHKSCVSGSYDFEKKKEEWSVVKKYLNSFSEQFVNDYLIDLYDAICDLKQFEFIDIYSNKHCDETYYYAETKGYKHLGGQYEQYYWIFHDIMKHPILTKHLENSELQEFMRNEYKGKDLDSKKIKYYLIIFGLKFLNEKYNNEGIKEREKKKSLERLLLRPEEEYLKDMYKIIQKIKPNFFVIHKNILNTIESFYDWVYQEYKNWSYRKDYERIEKIKNDPDIAKYFENSKLRKKFSDVKLDFDPSEESGLDAISFQIFYFGIKESKKYFNK